MKQKPKTKVLVAMSGGVDSSIAAYLMKKQGYQVIGVFMKNYSNSKEDNNCNWKEDRKEAMKIASKLQIPLITLDFEKQYRNLVVDEMFKLYQKGITPNPDVDCNQKIKFPLLRKAAKKLGAEFIVTGHYARIKRVKDSPRKNDSDDQQTKFNQRGFTPLILKDNWKNKPNSTADSGLSLKSESANKVSSKLKNSICYKLLRAKDESKDQSYFLYRLSQEDLEKSIFPIGEYTKKQVRALAKKLGFQNFNRKGTVGICFIGKVNMKKFLQKKIKPKEGKTLDPKGEQIGTHDGIFYYTIGQKIGPKFGIEIHKEGDNKKKLRKWYIARKNARKNEIIAAPEGHPLLYRKEIIVKQPHWIIFASDFGRAGGALSVKARIRQVGELLPSKLIYDKKKKQFKVTLRKAITGVSQGQAIVLYKGAVCLGGGVISF